MSSFTSSNTAATTEGIHTKPSWKRLEAHASEMKSMHLRNLLQDERRCASLVAEFQVNIFYISLNLLFLMAFLWLEYCAGLLSPEHLALHDGYAL